PLEAILDKEYRAKVPNFKFEQFTGRVASSDRVVLMELFTGAQCPPCVAADVAFDALTKTYKHSELVLVQHHMHIPGPDPLTNGDTEARWKYYQTAFKGLVRGVPTAIFNGMPEDPPKGGGGMANSEPVYTRYRGNIDEWLEKRAWVKVNAKADRKDEKI